MTNNVLKYVCRSLLMFVGIIPLSIYAVNPTNPSTSQVVLKAKAQAELSSQLDGKILEIPINEGDTFQKGADLVRFDCTIHAAQLSQAKASYQAKITLYNSNLKLQQAKAVSQVELADSQAKLAEAQADLNIKQHQVDMCRITAPFDGKLVKRHVYPHETVRQGQPLVQVMDNQDLEIELIVPSRWLAWLDVNEPFSLYVEETAKNYKAHVTKILPTVDAVSQSVRLLGKLDQPQPELVSGMSGRADFILRRLQ